MNKKSKQEIFTLFDDLYDDAFLQEDKENYPTLKFKVFGKRCPFTGDKQLEVKGSKAELIRRFTEQQLSPDDDQALINSEVDHFCKRLKPVDN